MGDPSEMLATFGSGNISRNSTDMAASPDPVLLLLQGASMPVEPKAGLHASPTGREAFAPEPTSSADTFKGWGVKFASFGPSPIPIPCGRCDMGKIRETEG